jgi:hypothetical protein
MAYGGAGISPVEVAEGFRFPGFATVVLAPAAASDGDSAEERR